MEILRLQKENKQLHKSIESLRSSSSKIEDLEQKNQELRNMLKSDKLESHSLNEVLKPIFLKGSVTLFYGIMLEYLLYSIKVAETSFNT